MTPERWQEIETLFEAVSDLSEQDRRRRLDELRANDPELAEEVASLLTFDRSSSQLAVRSSSAALSGEVLGGAQAFSPTLRPGDTLDRFRLLYPVSITEHSEVWCAEYHDLPAIEDGRHATLEQQSANPDSAPKGLGDDARQRVAIKLLRAADDSRKARFEQETRLLARLQHPNIADFLGAGRTEHGTPYIAMRFVSGLPLTQYADQNQLGIHERLRLVMCVCDAVAYAHRHLVVHRDLKPSNVLVSRDGQPIVLDFGISKQLDDNIGTTQTTTVERIMTPAYASPEQIHGEPVSTATDVYALGLVLYELMCGHHAYSEEACPGVTHFLDRVCKVLPKRPSEMVVESARVVDSPDSKPLNPRLIAALRSSSTVALKRRLSEQVDAVVMGAIAKEPSQRYASIGELRDDLLNVLEGRRVRVRTPTPSDRVSEYIGRNPARTLIVAVAVTGLLVAAVSSFIHTKVETARLAVLERRQQQDRNTLRDQQAQLRTEVERNLRRLLMSQDDGTRFATFEPAVYDELEVETQALVALNAAGHGEYETAQAMLAAIALPASAPLAVKLNLAKAYRTLGRPSAGLRLLAEYTPDVSAVRTLGVDSALAIDLVCTQLELLLDAERFQDASDWQTSGLVSAGMAWELPRYIVLTGQLRQQVGWHDGAEEVCNWVDRNRNGLTFTETQESTIRLLAAKVAFARGEIGSQQETLEREASVVDPGRSELTAQAQMLLAKSATARDDMATARRHLNEAIGTLRQNGLTRHWRIQSALWELSGIEEPDEDDVQGNKSRDSIDWAAKCWQFSSDNRETLTRTAILAATEMMQRSYQSDKLDELKRQLEELKPNASAYQSDGFLHRRILWFRFAIQIADDDRERALETIEQLRAMEAKLWGKNSIEATVALAARGDVCDALGRSSHDDLEAVVENTRQIASENSGQPAVAFLQPVLEYQQSDKSKSIYEWVEQYNMFDDEPVATQLEMVLYLLNDLVATGNKRDARVCYMAAKSALNELVALAVESPNPTSAGADLNRFVENCRALGIE